MANTIAGLSQQLKKLSPTITDSSTKLAIQNLENKIQELDSRLTDLERRAKAGNI